MIFLMQWKGATGVRTTVPFWLRLLITLPGILFLGFLSMISLTPAEAKEDAALSERRVAYQIDVKLDPGKKQLLGTERIRWRHPGKKPVSEIYIHLYPNAFSKGSTFIKESGGVLREDKMDQRSPGWMEITALRLADGTNLLPAMRFVQPDDGNPDDRTLARVDLPRPVKPGTSLELEVAFRVQLPKVFARMGYFEEFVMAGQWFPKLAAYEVAGQRQRQEEGWNAHQYHAHSEFYADFGTFEVTITVPASYQVAATGKLAAEPKPKNGWKHVTFEALDVHDFAWAASPDFLVEKRTFPELGTKGITVLLYLDPAHQAAKERYFQITRQTMDRFGAWFGPYPYETLSIVVPPPGAGGAGGMEYPTLITAWDASVPVESLALEQVVVHELAHQYWYGMVANNEFEEPWLDEGLATYSENKMMSTILPHYSRLTMMTPILEPAPLSLPAWEYGDDAYAANVYLRAARVLAGIEEVVGEQEMFRILKTYFNRYRFSHPSTKDFLATINEVSGKNFDDFFNRFVFRERMVDYRIQNIHSEATAQPGRYKHRITLDVTDDIGQNVPILIRFADGHTEEITWNAKSGPNPVVLEGPAIQWAWIDPEFSNPMEIQHVNNLYRPVSQQTILTWARQLSFWLEHLKLWLF